MIVSGEDLSWGPTVRFIRARASTETCIDITGINSSRSARISAVGSMRGAL